MTRPSRFIWILTAMLGLTLACGPISTGLSPSPTSSTSSNFTSEPASSATGESGTQEIPLIPNPLNVQITLDTTKAQTGGVNGLALGFELTGQITNTTTFTFLVSEILVSLEADGTLVPAYGTPVTLTPVSAIEGLPFSQGFLAAIQLEPQGLFMLSPAMLMLTLPGEYKPGELVGFAADSNGDNFHLYPANIISGGGQTTVLFDILHFSVYGVAQATSQEIMTQHGRIPEREINQDDDLLVPLPPLSPDQAELDSILRDLLGQQHDLRIKPAIDRVFEIEGNCNYVDVVAQQFITWNAHVESGGASSFFKDEIARDTSVLSNSLLKCMQATCSICMGTPPINKQSVDSFLIHAFYAEKIATIAGNSSDAERWRDLANRCADNAKRPLPYPVVACFCVPPNCGESPAPATCPVP